MWREARSKIGYFNPNSEELMMMILGQPFIDVRNSLNSFTPENLPHVIRDKFVDEALDFLINNPDLHDKLEFDVATTCYTPYFEERVGRWKKFGFKDNEIEIMRVCFREHTILLLETGLKEMDILISKVDNLDEKRKYIVSDNSISEINKVKKLINLCSNEGTLPFSILARFAFIGNTFLKSFVDNKIISKSSFFSCISSCRRFSYSSIFLRRSSISSSDLF